MWIWDVVYPEHIYGLGKTKDTAKAHFLGGTTLLIHCECGAISFQVVIMRYATTVYLLSLLWILVPLLLWYKEWYIHQDNKIFHLAILILHSWHIFYHMDKLKMVSRYAFYICWCHRAGCCTHKTPCTKRHTYKHQIKGLESDIKWNKCWQKRRIIFFNLKNYVFILSLYRW